jgi:hypothetical protein
MNPTRMILTLIGVCGAGGFFSTRSWTPAGEMSRTRQLVSREAVLDRRCAAHLTSRLPALLLCKLWHATPPQQ